MQGEKPQALGQQRIRTEHGGHSPGGVARLAPPECSHVPRDWVADDSSLPACRLGLDMNAHPGGADEYG